MSQTDGAASETQEEVTKRSSTVGSLVVFTQPVTAVLKKAQQSVFLVAFYNGSPCSLNMHGTSTVPWPSLTQPVTAQSHWKKRKKTVFCRLLQPVILFLKQTSWLGVPWSPFYYLSSCSWSTYTPCMDQSSQSTDHVQWFLGRLSQLTSHVPKTLMTFNGTLTHLVNFLKEVELFMPVFQKDTYVSDVSIKYICQWGKVSIKKKS